MWLALCLVYAVFAAAQDNPTVDIANGSLSGLHLPDFDQNLFLGVPFAKPPVGDLRFAHPRPYDTPWSGLRDASAYGPSCYGAGPFSAGLQFDEDCLSLNVITPAGDHGEKLPVFVWIYGGGLIAGGAADPRYNLTYIVQTSKENGQPIIGVSINYRLHGFGFLSGGDIPAENTNFGFYDQRQALRWINENIAAFGGDPERVTIAGESAGGWSVGYQLLAFGGKHDGLFRSAIMESGNVFNKLESKDYYELQYSKLLKLSGCANATKALDCLREVPAAVLFEHFTDPSGGFFWGPVVDGLFFQRPPYKQMEEGVFAEVPILTGTNTDECTSDGLTPRGLFNTTEQLRDFLISGIEAVPGVPAPSPKLDPDDVERLLEIYPDDPTLGCPFNTGSERFAHLGYQYKRGAAIVGDYVMQTCRRRLAQIYSGKNLDVFSYRFDQEPWDGIEEDIVEEPPVGASHYAEIPYIFANPDPKVSNWIGPDHRYHELSKLMQSMWISFIATQNPNNHPARLQYPTWPSYRPDGGENIVFGVNKTYIEEDNYRDEGFQFFMDRWDKTIGADI